jgi:hypothetical protein
MTCSSSGGHAFDKNRGQLVASYIWAFPKSDGFSATLDCTSEIRTSLFLILGVAVGEIEQSYKLGYIRTTSDLSYAFGLFGKL